MTTYADAGVDIDKANDLVEAIKSLVKSTHNHTVRTDIGGFSGEIALPSGERISMATDGVGTKLMIAQQAGIHNTIGIDLVAMSVNDLIVNGSEPVAFLDYFACGKLDPQVAYEVIAGIAEGCILAQCPLIGGETAELPGMYPDGEYDLAGFAVGHPGVHRDPDPVIPGDILVGLSSNGLHSNGFSLVRKIIFEQLGLTVHDDIWEGTKVHEELLKPTRIYVRDLKNVFAQNLAKAAIHITGGGFQDNIPRAMPSNCTAIVDRTSWEVPRIFRYLQEHGEIDDIELYRTFNCGIGMVLAVSINKVQQFTEEIGGVVIGRVVERLPVGPFVFEEEEY